MDCDHIVITPGNDPLAASQSDQRGPLGRGSVHLNAESAMGAP
jgi:hypothetical protein